MSQPFAVISFYTLGTLYEKEAEGLISSCKHFGLEYSIEGIKNLGAWDRNCCQKPGFILKKLKQLKKPVLWIDIDAIVLQKLTFFENITCDLAVRIDEERALDYHSRLMGGTIYVNYNQNTLRLIKLWKEECSLQLKLAKGTKDVWDQACLHDVLMKQLIPIHLVKLTLPYCRVFDRPIDLMPMEETVILHCQASRLYKNFINQQCVAFPFLQGLNAEELKSIRYRLRT